MCWVHRPQIVYASYVCIRTRVTRSATQLVCYTPPLGRPRRRTSLSTPSAQHLAMAGWCPAKVAQALRRNRAASVVTSPVAEEPPAPAPYTTGTAVVLVGAQNTTPWKRDEAMLEARCLLELLGAEEFLILYPNGGHIWARQHVEDNCAESG